MKERTVVKNENIVVKQIVYDKDNTKSIFIENGLYSYNYSSIYWMKKLRQCNVYLVLLNNTKGDLTEPAKAVARVINDKRFQKQEITIYAHSKCGVMTVKTCEFVKRKIKIRLISVPFQGTITATPTAYMKQIQELANRITNKLPLRCRKVMQKKISAGLSSIYKVIFANSPGDQSIYLKAPFLRSLDYSILSKFDTLIFVSYCTKRQLRHDLCHPTRISGVFLYLLNKIMEIKGDGIVEKRSQILKKYNFNTFLLESSHATSLRDVISQFEA